MKRRNLWYYTVQLTRELFMLPLILTASLAVILWIMTMELIVSRFLSKKHNEKRNWELTYWHT